MRFTARALARRGPAARADLALDGADACSCGVGLCGHCQLGPTLICRDGAVYPYPDDRAATWGCGSCERSPKLAVWKFASCDGCQLSLLDCEDELLARRRRGRDRLLPRGDERDRRRARTTSRSSRARSRPPHDAERIHEVRQRRRRPSSRSAPARPPAGSRRCRTSPTSTTSSRPSTRRPSTSRRSRTSTRDLRARPGRLRAPAAARSTSASSLEVLDRVPRTAAGRTSPTTRVCIECKRRGTPA